LSGEEQLRTLVEEQAALRRVATLVASGAAPEKVFAVVTEELRQVLSVEYAHLGRYESDDTVIFVAASGPTDGALPVGARMTLGGKNVTTLVFQTGCPARIDRYSDASGPVAVAARERGVRSSVATPITVQGRLWGVMVVGSSRVPQLSTDTEPRLASFTELVATAVANAESRTTLARLAEEQAALRRVATLVARGAAAEEVVAVVTEEIGQLLPVEFAIMGRFEAEAVVTSVAAWGAPVVAGFPVGSRWGLEGKNLVTIVRDTGRPARVDRFAHASGPIGVAGRAGGFRSAVGTPIIVESRLWGVLCVGSTALEPMLPADTEARLASFTDLVAMAIANAESRAELNASRARIVAAADQTRRRIERDLHDGTQQQLVSLMLELRAAQATQDPEVGELKARLAATERGLARVFEELREISRGIHPAILSRGGLGPALTGLARRSTLPVELDLRAEGRLPEPVEVAAYYAVSEALTNAAKHAHASAVKVELDGHGASLRLTIRDDGVGGADLDRGSGLVGLSDRVEALGGIFQVSSPPGSGTKVLIEIPLEGQSSAAA
jgi:signal transduction histidine kinase